jgi:glycosyltransferase involved in cell wall biosynthesis
MNLPFITVVIPLFNKKTTIRRALLSVLCQSIKDLEVIVVDDGSTDHSFEAIDDIEDPRLRLVKQTNQGVSAARNLGVMLAKSDYVAFLDADDYYKPDFLQHITTLIQQDPDAGIFCCRLEFVDENQKAFIPKAYLKEEFCGEVKNFISLFSKDRGVIHPSSMAVKKNAFLLAGGFAVGKHVGEDILLILKMALQYRVMHDSYCGSIIFRDAENRTRDRKPGQLSVHLEYFLTNQDWKRSLSFKQIQDVTRFCCHNTILHAAGAVLNSQRKLAWKYCWLVFPVSIVTATKVALIACCPTTILNTLKQARNT